MNPLDYIKNHVCVPAFPGWSTTKKCSVLYGCVLETAANISVDLGAFAGRGSICMAFGHRQQGFGHCFAIDAWDNEVAAKNQQEPANKDYWARVPMGDIKSYFIKRRASENLEDYIKILSMPSDEAVKQFEDGSVDVLHFDADHSEAASVNDILKWMPKVSPSGYICFDDTDWTEHGVCTTLKAQQILLDAGYTVTHKEIKDDEECNEWKMFLKPETITPTEESNEKN